MTTYMGPGLGSLVPVKCLSGLSVQPSTRMAVAGDGGLSGRRIYVDPPSRPALRTWSANISVSDPNEVGTLVELESLRQALWMVSDEASANNVLTPAAAVGPVGWMNATQGAPVALAGGGFAASSVQSTSGGNLFGPLFPVVPGESVSVSAHVRALTGVTGTFRLDWMALGTPQNGTQSAIGASRAFTATAAPLPLVTMSATPPANVHVARLRFLNTAQVARPAATWTATPRPWMPGAGAESVHLSPLSHDVIMAVRGDRSLSSYSYTVTEVSA